MRLIDADELIDWICNDSGDKMMDEYYIEHINNMPTAYNVDKVVEQLENDEKHTFDGCINKRYAIEIVKGGGVDDNMPK